MSHMEDTACPGKMDIIGVHWKDMFVLSIFRASPEFSCHFHTRLQGSFCAVYTGLCRERQLPWYVWNFFDEKPESGKWLHTSGGRDGKEACHTNITYI